jgi:hypothetical protein
MIMVSTCSGSAIGARCSVAKKGPISVDAIAVVLGEDTYYGTGRVYDPR